MKTEKEKKREELVSKLVVGCLVLACGAVTVIDTTVVKPYLFLKELFQRQR